MPVVKGMVAGPPWLQSQMRFCSERSILKLGSLRVSLYFASRAPIMLNAQQYPPAPWLSAGVSQFWPLSVSPVEGVSQSRRRAEKSDGRRHQAGQQEHQVASQSFHRRRLFELFTVRVYGSSQTTRKPVHLWRTRIGRSARSLAGRAIGFGQSGRSRRSAPESTASPQRPRASLGREPNAASGRICPRFSSGSKLPPNIAVIAGAVKLSARIVAPPLYTHRAMIVRLVLSSDGGARTMVCCRDSPSFALRAGAPSNHVVTVLCVGYASA